MNRYKVTYKKKYPPHYPNPDLDERTVYVVAGDVESVVEYFKKESIGVIPGSLITAVIQGVTPTGRVDYVTGGSE